MVIFVFKDYPKIEYSWIGILKDAVINLDF